MKARNFLSLVSLKTLYRSVNYPGKQSQVA